MHYQQGGEKYPIHVSRGNFCIKGRKIGRNAFVQGELAFMLFGALFRLNFSCALLSMVSSPFASPWGISNFGAFYLGCVEPLPLRKGTEIFLTQVIVSCLLFGFWSLVWVFSLFSVLFLLSLNWLLVCVANALIKGEIEDRSVRGPVDGCFWLWWVIDNVVCTDSGPSITGAGCGWICVGAGEERAWKVYALWGFRGLERQVGSAWGTQVASGVKCGPHGGKKSKTKSWTGASAG
jgi:hypothetical protein